METPDTYVCSSCGASHCKLWRQYQTFANHIELLCAPCAAADQDAPIDDIDGNGLRCHDRAPEWNDPAWRTDQIGNLVPAVMDDDGSFWGYTSVPPEGVRWWQLLPTLPADFPQGEKPT